MNLDPQLVRLESSQLVRRLDEPDLAYMFKHALVQDTVYASLLILERRRLHQAVGESFERIYPDELDENAARLAQHFSIAGDEGKALEYEIRAGDSAARVYATNEAMAHYGRALELGQRMDERALAGLYLKRGRVLELAGRFGEAVRNYEAMQARGRERGDPGLELQALMARATVHSILGAAQDPQQARALSEQALVLAREIGDRGAEAKIFWNLMLVNNWSGGDPAQAIAYGEQSLALAKQVGAREQIALTQQDLMLAYFQMGRFEQALAAAAVARRIFQDNNNQPMIGENLVTTAVIYYLRGELAQALEIGTAALEIARRISNQEGQGISFVVLSRVEWEYGELERALGMLRGMIQIAQELGITGPILSIYAETAWLYGTLGAPELGLELIARAHARRDADSPVWHSMLSAAEARLSLAQGQFDQAAAHAAQISVVSPQDYMNARTFAPTFALLTLSELALAAGDAARVLDMLEPAIHALEQLGLRPFVGELLYVQARAQLALGDHTAAERALSRAVEINQGMGSRRITWQILAALGEIERARGNPREAEILDAQASAQLEFLAAHVPPEFRASFLNLPQVQELYPEQVKISARSEM